MQENKAFQASIKFGEPEKTAANQDIIDRVTRVLFVVFMPDDVSMSEEETEELFDDVSGMAKVLMAVAGMKIIGRNSDGDYVARFKPYKSLEHFGKENGL
jgi:hypothetical protein